jgi:ABC-type multidrug transport system fused ATPase/permease subunit
LRGGLDQYALAIANLRSATTEYGTLHIYLNQLSDVADADDAIDLPPSKKPTIEFINVSFDYGGNKILNNVSFKVEGGQTLGLVGSSGCGKSTIMRLLLRFYRPSAGTILIDNHDITHMTGKSLRRLFSVVTQDANLSNVTIRDNIAYGKMGSTDVEILAAARLAELELKDHAVISTEEASSTVPTGSQENTNDVLDEQDLALDKFCGEKGAKLSGGQQQRVAIARALAMDPKIMLFDEVTSALDPELVDEVLTVLRKLAADSDTTMLTVTHEMNFAREFADRVLFFDGGQIVEAGLPKDIFSNPQEIRTKEFLKKFINNIN